MRVLIADDDPISLRLLQANLIKLGYEVLTARDGTEAWKILRGAQAPRLVILDWMMPGIDGIQICRMIRQRRGKQYTYVLLLTAKNRREDIIEGLDAGADDYVTKPFDPHELSARLRAGARMLDLQTKLVVTRESLRQQATRDPLTDLPNRLCFSDRLTRRLAEARRGRQTLAVMFLDLDNFKLVNDSMGHEAGDLLLAGVAARLTTALRRGDTVARMGGDEFTLILADIGSLQNAVSIAQKVMDSLSRPFAIDGQEVFVSASVGVSVYPGDGSDVETLVKNADTAMYRAKESGRNCCQFYNQTSSAAVAARVTIEKDLRKAMERGQLVLHYQPRVSLGTGETTGAEALMRWQHPKLGLLTPVQFIPLAEETGLIVHMSEWLLESACAQGKAWHDAGHDINIAVNISARHFWQGDLVSAVDKALKKSQLDPEALTIEVTESSLVRGPEKAAGILRELRKTGVRVAIDDFGTGYSSLNCLKKLPVDIVKVDRSFVKDIRPEGQDAEIVRAIVSMAHNLGLKVIAEGVETLGQLEFLRSLDCDEMQGYFVSAALPPDEFEMLLRSKQDWALDGLLRAA